MKRFALVLGCILAASGAPAQADTHQHGMSQQQVAQQTASIHSGTGVLKAVNVQDNKVQITHKPIAELGWPAMTMWFALRDALPQGLKVGDAVRFEMLQNDKRQWVIVRIGRE